MKAVVDRFENDDAVMFFGNDEQQVIIPRKMLPEGTREGSWLKITFELDSEGENNQRARVQNLLDKLKSK